MMNLVNFNPKTILISAQMGIGNAILFLPFLSLLRSSLPATKITLYMTHANGAEQVFEICKGHYIDDVILMQPNKKSLLAKFFFGVRIGLQGWDAAIFRFNGLDFVGLIASIAGRIKFRIGHVSSDDWSGRWDKLLNVPVTMDSGSHEIQRYLKICKVIGMTQSVSCPRLPLDFASEKLVGNVNELLMQNDLLGEKYAVLVPGSSVSQDWKRWPLESWAELALELYQSKIRFIFLGSLDEKHLIDTLVESLKLPTRLNFAGLTNLRESFYLISASSVVVSCDSALMHVAGALDTSTVAIFGPTDESRTGPVGVKSKLLRSQYCKGACYSLSDPVGHLNCDTQRCMRDVSVSDVFAAVVASLDG